jgi:hypothetical protein
MVIFGEFYNKKSSGIQSFKPFDAWLISPWVKGNFQAFESSDIALATLKDSGAKILMI